MKMIAALIAGLVLGMTGTALGQTSFWKRSSPGVYYCQGINASVSCRSEAYTPRYSILLSRGKLFVAFRNNVLFVCETRYTPKGCTDFR